MPCKLRSLMPSKCRSKGVCTHPSQNVASALSSASKMRSTWTNPPDVLTASDSLHSAWVSNPESHPAQLRLREGEDCLRYLWGSHAGDHCPRGFIDFCGEGVCDLSWKYLCSKERNLGVSVMSLGHSLPATFLIQRVLPCGSSRCQSSLTQGRAGAGGGGGAGRALYLRPKPPKPEWRSKL